MLVGFQFNIVLDPIFCATGGVQVRRNILSSLTKPVKSTRMKKLNYFKIFNAEQLHPRRRHGPFLLSCTCATSMSRGRRRQLYKACDHQLPWSDVVSIWTTLKLSLTLQLALLCWNTWSPEVPHSLLPGSPFFRSTQHSPGKAGTNYTISKTKSTRILASKCYEVKGKLCFTISSLLVVISKST